MTLSVNVHDAKFYIDGARLGTADITLPEVVLDSTSYPHWIGTNGFTGYVYKLCIYNYDKSTFGTTNLPDNTCGPQETLVGPDCMDCEGCECIQTTNCSNCVDEYCLECSTRYEVCDQSCVG
jgi:hypothetical protein